MEGVSDLRGRRAQHPDRGRTAMGLRPALSPTFRTALYPLAGAPAQSDPLPPPGRRRRFIFDDIFGLVYRQARNPTIGEIEPR